MKLNIFNMKMNLMCPFDKYYPYLSNYHYTVKPDISSHSKEYQKLVFKSNYLLMQVKSIKTGFTVEFKPIN